MAARSDSESSQPSVSRLLSQRAQHHGLVTGIAGQNPAFSPAARLAVRWVGAHMLAGVHLTVEAVELVVAAAFLPGTAALPAPGETPNRPQPFLCRRLCLCSVLSGSLQI